MAAIPDHVLVLGLARSGRAAVTALRAKGATVSAHDANADRYAGERSSEVGNVGRGDGGGSAARALATQLELDPSAVPAVYDYAPGDVIAGAARLET